MASLAARQLHPAWRSSASRRQAVKEISLIELDFNQINGSYLFTKTLLVEVKLTLFLIEKDVTIFGNDVAITL